ncbi:MAG: S1/P1 nuclease [Rikenellaceae bacterium]|jgi:hypothetical protein|nr:S1/P1 nuclease [Rikenellaceae bacterium]
MKNKHTSTVIFILFALLNVFPLYGWGGKGHNAIAIIAQDHLTCSAERKVTRLLGGYNMAYWSTWADGLRDDSRYDAFTSWHFANVEKGLTYAAAPKNPKGDVYTAVMLCTEQLKSPATSDSLKTMYLKFLIHFVGDMHCPMHAGYLSDRGGNSFSVIWSGNKTSLHKVWDSQLIDAARPWSALEWAINIDRKMSRRERKALSAGDPAEWLEGTVDIAHLLYRDTPQDKSLYWDYINKYGPVVEQQFLLGGYRLARLLNEIF